MMRTLLFTILAVSAAVATPEAIAQTESAATARTQYVDVAGDRIAYRAIGSGSPIVAVTRMRGTLDTWDPLFLDTLAKSHRVITVDWPGVGYSEGTLPSDMGQAAAFIDTFTRVMKIDRYAVMGWSWGGLATQALVTDRPERLTHAILVGTHPPGPPLQDLSPAFLERAFKPVNDLADEEVLFFEPSSAASRAAAKASRERIHARPGVDAKIPSTEAEIKAYLSAAKQFREDAPRRDALKQTKVPILIVSGDNDISTQAANWFPLSNELPTAQLLVLPDAGHAPQHQYPELSARYIVDFIALTP